MKFFKSLAAICCVVVCALTMTSCETETITKVYSLGISHYESQSSGFGTSDLALIEAYLSSKCLPYSYPDNVYNAFDSNAEKCDKKAKAYFDELTKKLSYEEVAQLGLTDSCKFEYSIRRLKDDRDPYSETLYIGVWAYPKK